MFDRPINIEHNQIQKKNILTADENYFGIQHIKRICLYLAVLICNF